MLKVLIVDDEAVVRRGIVLGIDWASLGCAVVGEAANGEEGLAAAERYSPNLIITDVRMPHMDGIEMMRVLRERGSTAHVIVLTAYNDFDYARSALRFGAADYLLKHGQQKRHGQISENRNERIELGLLEIVEEKIVICSLGILLSGNEQHRRYTQGDERSVLEKRFNGLADLDFLLGRL